MTQIFDYPTGPVRPENDRSGRVLAAGIILIICGVASSCFLLLMPLAYFAPRQPGQDPLPVSQLVAGGVMYLVLAIIFITLGIGGVGKRRWFRPFTLILSIHWLILGAFSLISSIAVIPLIYDFMVSQIQSASVRSISIEFVPVILLIGMLLGLVIGVVLPLIILMLIKSLDVKSTLEFYSPATWTDRRPIQILGLAITLILAGLISLSMLTYSFVPMISLLITGVPAMILIIIASALLIFAGYRVLKLDMRGWWIGLIVVTLFSLCAVPTPLFVSPVEYYRLLHQPPEMLRVAEKYETLLRITTILFPLLMAVSFPVYMFRLKPQLQQANVNKHMSAGTGA